MAKKTKTTAKESEVRFQIVNVRVKNFELQEQVETLAEDIPITMDVQTSNTIDVKKTLFISSIKVSVRLKDDSKLLGSIETECIFIIDNMQEYKDQGNKVKLSNNIVDILNGMVYSTSRGVFASYFKGTYLANYVLPVIDPSQLRENENNTLNKNE